MTLGMLAMRQFWPVDYWAEDWLVFEIQPVRVPLFAGYFMAGVIAYLDGWFTEGGYQPRVIPWSLTWLISGVLYVLWMGDLLYPYGHSGMMDHAQFAIFFNTFCLSSLMVGLALFQRYVNGNDRIQKSLAANSYGIYYVHPLILYPLAYLFMGIQMPLYLKAGVVICLGFLASWLASALVLRRLPLLNRVF
jgi:hypothetical protein